MSLLANHPSFRAAMGTVLALAAVATALILAAVRPALHGHVLALATGIGLGTIALTVTIATAAIWRLRLPSNNDAWVFW
jgi:hypothetical protein